MNAEPLHRLYEELAQRSQRALEAPQRDMFYVLAADAALASGRAEEAERLRQRLLEVNPHSLLRPYASFAEALESSDIQDYVAELRRQFPPCQAEKCLQGDNSNNAAAIPHRFFESDALRLAGTSPRREQGPSPYEQYDVPPLPAGKGGDVIGRWAALLLYLLVLLGAISLAVYIAVRPFLR